MKLFVLLSRVPFPIVKGDKLRAYHQIRCLSKNHEIFLCALNDTKIDEEALPELNKYCTSITVVNLSKLCIIWNIFRAFISGKPLQVGYFFSKKAKKTVDRVIQEIKPDHIYCQLVRVAEYVSDKDIPKTIDYQDAFSKGVERRIATSPFWLKPVLKIEYKRLLRYERQVFDIFDHRTIISRPDRDLIPHPKREEIVIVPNGVDQAFFKPIEREKIYDIIFTGNMGYPPNVNAAVFLVNEVVPIVKKKLPDVRVILAGATPHPRVLALASAHVHVTGYVKDIREYYAQAKIFIAPMQIGIGLQNKLLEAMAMKIPSITSRLANNALGAKENEEILVGSTPEEMAGHTLTLLNDKSKADQLALNGYNFVLRHYSWEVNTKILDELIKNTMK
ncbi:MAG: glycosyltransferase [Bacteroidetes bacterium]|nr:glycosyltransferase [Bacteroidota bacterium]